MAGIGYLCFNNESSDHMWSFEVDFFSRKNITVQAPFAGIKCPELEIQPGEMQVIWWRTYPCYRVEFEIINCVFKKTTAAKRKVSNNSPGLSPGGFSPAKMRPTLAQSKFFGNTLPDIVEEEHEPMPKPTKIADPYPKTPQTQMDRLFKSFETPSTPPKVIFPKPTPTPQKFIAPKPQPPKLISPKPTPPLPNPAPTPAPAPLPSPKKIKTHPKASAPSNLTIPKLLDGKDVGISCEIQKSPDEMIYSYKNNSTYYCLDEIIAWG